jgi:uncharacterized tellurite resistance protein B-like protein
MAGTLRFRKRGCVGSPRWPFRNSTYGSGRRRCSDQSRPSSQASLRIRDHEISDHKARLATAALLIRVATVDSEMSEAKLKRLHGILKSRFGLDELATLYQFTRRINDALDNEGRRRTVEMMWEMIYVDGGANGFEANVIWRTADLLGVSARQRIESRQQVAAGRSVLAPS